MDLTDSPPPFLPPALRKALPYFLLALAGMLAYANIYNNEFVYDDDILIVKNHFLRSWHFIPAIFASSATGGANIPGGFYRPLQILLYLVIYQLGGVSELPFHVVNLALHIASACLVYALGRRLNFQPVAVFLAALIWALQPVAVEAVTYISATADPLYACLSLASVLALARNKMILSSALFILALLTKETAIVVPLLAACCVYVSNPQRLKLKTYLPIWPLAVIALTYAAFRIFYMNFDHFVLYTRQDIYATSIASRVETFLATLPAYAKLLVWPAGLHLDRNFAVYDDPLNPDVLIGGALLLALAAQIVRGQGKRGLALSFGILWFFSAHLLHTGIPKPLNSLFLEHWMYLPTAGLYLGLAESAGRGLAVLNRQWLNYAVVILALMIALIFGALTYRQNETWYDSIALYQNIFANGETSAHAYTNLGVVYTKQGKYEDALAQYRLAFQSAHDTDAQPEHDYAVTVLMEGDDQAHRDDAIAHFKRALAIDPDFYPSAEALANLYGRLGNAEQAVYYRHRAESAHEKLAPNSGAAQDVTP